MKDFKKLKKLLLAEKTRAPRSEIVDYYKLIFQSVFGAGHLITNPQSTIQYLTEEWNKVEENTLTSWGSDITLLTPMIRLNLARCKAERIPLTELSDAFLQGCYQFNKPSSFVFKQVLMETIEILQVPPFGFSFTLLNQLLPINLSDDFPIMHHSEIYRNLYYPRYRVFPLSQIKREWGCIFP